MVIRPNLHYSKIYQKRIHGFLRNRTKIRTPRHLAQLSIWISGPGILDIDTLFNCLKTKWIQRFLNPTNDLWKNLMLYQYNLILIYNQGLALFRQKQILRSTCHKHLQKHSNEDYFIPIVQCFATFYQ